MKKVKGEIYYGIIVIACIIGMGYSVFEHTFFHPYLFFIISGIGFTTLAILYNKKNKSYE